MPEVLKQMHFLLDHFYSQSSLDLLVRFGALSPVYSNSSVFLTFSLSSDPANEDGKDLRWGVRVGGGVKWCRVETGFYGASGIIENVCVSQVSCCSQALG